MVKKLIITAIAILFYNSNVGAQTFQCPSESDARSALEQMFGYNTEIYGHNWNYRVLENIVTGDLGAAGQAIYNPKVLHTAFLTDNAISCRYTFLDYLADGNWKPMQQFNLTHEFVGDEIGKVCNFPEGGNTKNGGVERVCSNPHDCRVVCN